MMEYDVELLPSAQTDVDQVRDYFREKSINAAIAFLDDIARAMNQLAKFPESGQLSRDESLAARGYRVVLVKYDYLLFYKFDDEKVIVFRVINGRRNYGVFI